jgi:hypothetical protein
VSHIFTLEELTFLLRIHGFLTPRDKQLRLAEREHMLRETGNRKPILKAHSEALLKAWRFWDENYDSNYGVWRNRIRTMPRVYTPDELVWLLERGMISPSEAASGVVCRDEGYSSE